MRLSEDLSLDLFLSWHNYILLWINPDKCSVRFKMSEYSSDANYDAALDDPVARAKQVSPFVSCISLRFGWGIARYQYRVDCLIGVKVTGTGFAPFCPTTQGSATMTSTRAWSWASEKAIYHSRTLINFPNEFCPYPMTMLLSLLMILHFLSNLILFPLLMSWFYSFQAFLVETWFSSTFLVPFCFSFWCFSCSLLSWIWSILSVDAIESWYHCIVILDVSSFFHAIFAFELSMCVPLWPTWHCLFYSNISSWFPLLMFNFDVTFAHVPCIVVFAYHI